jgi:hypothetical protein
MLTENCFTAKEKPKARQTIITELFHDADNKPEWFVWQKVHGETVPIPLNISKESTREIVSEDACNICSSRSSRSNTSDISTSSKPGAAFSCSRPL